MAEANKEDIFAANKHTEIINNIKKKDKNEITHQEISVIANQIRRYIVEMVHLANSGHPGGALGLADIYATLYFKILNHNPNDYKWDERDRLILSNGHVCAVRYAAMAVAGYFNEKELSSFRTLGSKFQGHPSTRYLPELENSSGSLGQGLSFASGTALGLKQQKNNARVYVCISDGECQEGMTWEAAMAASHYKLDNLTAFVDYNKIQIDGWTDKVMSLGDLGKKFESFGWNTIEADGHDIKQIENAFNKTKEISGKPSVILFNTILGKGVSFMENNPAWHGSPPNKEDRDKALDELNSLF
ncbi:MAG: transketolase [Spirochaetia bacterium]|nr:transketolase [Spirochaetia bacterium]